MRLIIFPVAYEYIVHIYDIYLPVIQILSLKWTSFRLGSLSSNSSTRTDTNLHSTRETFDLSSYSKCLTV